LFGHQHFYNQAYWTYFSKKNQNFPENGHENKHHFQKNIKNMKSHYREPGFQPISITRYILHHNTAKWAIQSFYLIKSMSISLKAYFFRKVPTGRYFCTQLWPIFSQKSVKKAVKIFFTLITYIIKYF